ANGRGEEDCQKPVRPAGAGFSATARLSHELFVRSWRTFLRKWGGFADCYENRGTSVAGATRGVAKQLIINFWSNGVPSLQRCNTSFLRQNGRVQSCARIAMASGRGPSS